METNGKRLVNDFSHTADDAPSRENPPGRREEQMRRAGEENLIHPDRRGLDTEFNTQPRLHSCFGRRAGEMPGASGLMRSGVLVEDFGFGPGQCGCPKPPRQCGGDRRCEEYPHVRAVARTRAFESRRDIPLTARFHKRPGVFSPGLLIEINGEKPTGFVNQQRVYANRDPAGQVIVYGLICQRQELTCLPVAFLPFRFRERTQRIPIAPASRGISSLSIGRFEPDCIHILATAKERAKQRYLFGDCEFGSADLDWSRRRIVCKGIELFRKESQVFCA